MSLGGGGGGGSFNPPPGGKGDIPNPWTFSSGGTIAQTDVTQTPGPAHGDITGEAPAAKDPDQLQGSLTWAASQNTLPPQTFGTTINYTAASSGAAPFTGLWESPMVGVCSAAAQTGALGSFSPGTVNGYTIVAMGRVTVLGNPYFLIEMAPGTPQNFFSNLTVTQSSTTLGSFTEATATFVPQGNTILGLVPSLPGPSWYWPCPFNMTGGVAGTFVFSAPVVPPPSPLRGDISADAQYSPDGRATPVVFASGGKPLVAAPVARNLGQGDIMLTYEGADGQKQTVYGEITWANGGATLALGPVTKVTAGKGDITGDYGSNELWKEIATWAAGNNVLVVGPLPTPQGHGDFPDPNTWQDAIFYLTSQLYPLYVEEHMSGVGVAPNSPYYAGPPEHLQFGAFIGATQYYLALVVYSNWPTFGTDHMQFTGAFAGGSLNTGGGTFTYSNWPAEHMQFTAAAPSGNFYLALITYSNWPAEHLQFSAAFSGGTLT